MVCCEELEAGIALLVTSLRNYHFQRRVNGRARKIVGYIAGSPLTPVSIFGHAIVITGRIGTERDRWQNVTIRISTRDLRNLSVSAPSRGINNSLIQLFVAC